MVAEDAADTRSAEVYDNGDTAWAVENVNFYVAGQTFLVDGYTVAEFSNPDYTITFEVDGATKEMFYWAKKSFVDNQPKLEDYTAFVIEYLNRADRVDGDPEYFVESVVHGGGIFTSGHSMLTLAPKTDMGFVFYIPTALLNAENMPSRGDTIFTNFWHGSPDLIIGNDGWGKLIIDGVDSGRVARVLTNNTVDYLEDSGRCVMQETVTGRYFVDLYRLESALQAYPGVTDAEAYIVYGVNMNNKLDLTAEVTAEKETDLAGLKEYGGGKFKVSAQPSKLIVNGTELS